MQLKVNCTEEVKASVVCSVNWKIFVVSYVGIYIDMYNYGVQISFHIFY